MRCPLAHRRPTATRPPYVPTLAPEDYAGTVLALRGRGTVTVLDDGRGTVHDLEGRAVTTLPAHTVRELLTREGAGVM